MRLDKSKGSKAETDVPAGQQAAAKLQSVDFGSMLSLIDQLRGVVDGGEGFRAELNCVKKFSAYTAHSAALDTAMLKLQKVAS